jgi:hypothetical protein
MGHLKEPMMKLIFFFSLFMTNMSFAEVPLDYERDLPLILEAQEALKDSKCSLRLETYKDNISIQLRSPHKSDSSNFHRTITTKKEDLRENKRVTTFTTTWFQHVLFSHKKFVTKLIITENESVISEVKMKTRVTGATVYYPVFRSSTVKCKIEE